MKVTVERPDGTTFETTEERWNSLDMQQDARRLELKLKSETAEEAADEKKNADGGQE